MALAHAAGHLQQFRERRAERDFVVPRLVHMAGDTEYLGAAIVGLAEVQEPVGAVGQDVRHRGQRLRIINSGRAAVEAEAGRERRLEARQAFLAFNGIQQCGFLAADIGPGTEVRIEVEIDPAAENVFTQQTGLDRFFDGRLATFVRLPEFAADVVVADGCADGVTGDGHALDQRMRVIAHDVAVLAGPRLAFVRIADDVFLPGRRAWHEAPLEAGVETGTAAATQGRGLERFDDLGRIGLFLEYLAPDLITARILVGLERPRFGLVEVSEQQWSLGGGDGAHLRAPSI